MQRMGETPMLRLKHGVAALEARSPRPLRPRIASFQKVPTSGCIALNRLTISGDLWRGRQCRRRVK